MANRTVVRAPRRSLVWGNYTGTIIQLVNSTSVIQTIFSSTDLASVGSKPTIVRLRGAAACMMDTSGATGGAKASVAAGILVLPENVVVGFPNPFGGATYPWVWQGRFLVSKDDVGTNETNAMDRQIVDNKAMRKVGVAQKLALVVENGASIAGTAPIEFWMSLRILLMPS